jgi:hypothetical protein
MARRATVTAAARPMPGAEPDAGEPDGGGEPDAGVAQGCPAEVEPAQLVEGTWDDRLTIAGFTGHDGPAPRIASSRSRRSARSAAA